MPPLRQADPAHRPRRPFNLFLFALPKVEVNVRGASSEFTCFKEARTTEETRF